MPEGGHDVRCLWIAATEVDIHRFVRALTSAYEVVGARERRGRLTLDRIGDPSDLCLDYPPRVHSPKKFLFPNWEKLFRFRLQGTVRLEAEHAAPPRVLFGLHPCDLHAVRILDDCLFDGQPDSAYRAKREASVLVGVDCEPDEHCFCTSLGTDRAASGFDLFLHRDGDRFLVQVGSGRGRALLERFAPQWLARPAEDPLPLQPKRTRKRLVRAPEVLASVLEDGYDDPIWEEIGERCLGCGTCTLLCPSCYCFTVEDRLQLDLAGGERVRVWDSCQFDQFTQLSGGGEARANQADRQRHRFFRKYKYLWDKYRRTACVGCGRCSRECLARIDPVEVLNRLVEEREARARTPRPPGGEYRPELAELVAAEPLAPGVRRLKLRLSRPVSFVPGAFLTVSVFGLGEAPFTIASAPDGGRHVELAVAAQGALTRALHRLETGNVVGVRGPFGTGYPLDEMAGRDVLLVAGGLGIVILRSLLLTLVGQRRAYGRIVLLYGARNPDALLFRDDLRQWLDGGLVDVRLIVEEPGSAWTGPRGNVVRLFRRLDLDPRRTVAAVSGPPDMYRFTTPLLAELGIGPHRIFLNLERRMKCGLGKCGKCRIDDLCVCEQGPVLRYDRVQELREAVER